MRRSKHPASADPCSAALRRQTDNALVGDEQTCGDELALSRVQHDQSTRASPVEVDCASIVCWTRMQAEAGQALEAILARKEIERRIGKGAFYWGIGNPRPRPVPKLARAGCTIDLIFSRMKGQPKAIDVEPPAVLVWRRYIDTDGAVQPLPQHVLITSRGGKGRRSHYALVCHSDKPLHFGDHGPFDPAAYQNLSEAGAPVGASQVTALLRSIRTPGEESGYRVNLRAQLTGPLWVRLADPRVLPAAERSAFERRVPTVSVAEWPEFVAEIRADDVKGMLGDWDQLPLI